jgi:glutamyl-tRNA synthetase
MHIGGLFAAFVAWKFVQQNDGKFILRIEDTDQKRLVDNAIDHLISSLRNFDLVMHE